MSNIPNAGNGLFVKENETVAKGEILSTYGGYTYSRQEIFDNNLETYAVELNDGSGRIVAGDNQTDDLGMYINGKKTGDNVMVNCKLESRDTLYYYTHDNRLRVRFSVRATKDIRAGDEIITKYGSNYWLTIIKKYGIQTATCHRMYF